MNSYEFLRIPGPRVARAVRPALHAPAELLVLLPVALVDAAVLMGVLRRAGRWAGGPRLKGITLNSLELHRILMNSYGFL